MIRSAVLAGVALSVVLGATNLMAQQGGGGGRNRGNFDPAQMRARMMERYQTALEASDAEWKVIEPLINEVNQKQMATRMARFNRGGAGGRGGAQPAPGTADRPQRQQGPQGGRGGFGMNAEPSPEVEALQKALDSKDTSASEIKTKLSALRDSKKKQEKELVTAQEKLRAVLTVRQEASLVMMGMLD